MMIAHHHVALECIVKAPSFTAAPFLFSVYLTKVYVHHPHRGSFLAQKGIRFCPARDSSADEVFRDPEYWNSKKTECVIDGGYVVSVMVLE
jgi:hypothetical protein